MTTQQRTNLKFLDCLGKSLSEALCMLQQVYQQQTLCCSIVFLWHKRFKEGHEDVEDDPRGRRPSTSSNETNVKLVKKIVHGDCLLTVRLISDKLGLNQNNLWQIITEDLGMRKVWAKMVPKLLNNGQKMWHMQVCQDILQNFDSNPDFLKKVITGDETWVFEYDPETKHQSLHWRVLNHHRSKKRGNQSAKSSSC